ncbi:MAG: hypothetical protein K0S27_945 [Gammaproteobacteria bacterium]|jgi:hexokinase|nr:hypothetical protein [Gammaproteobacteria bacterium]
MAALTPTSNTAATAARKIVGGGSTKIMLISLERALGKTTLPPTTSYFVKEITANSRLKSVQETITHLKEKRESVFGVKTELNALILSLEQSTLKLDLKNTLLSRAKDLLTSIEQAIEIDGRFSSLETALMILESQRLQTKQENYKIIQNAANPQEKAAELSNTSNTNQSKIEGYKKETTQLTKLFEHIYRKIGAEYTFLRDSAPGSFKMRTFQDFSKISGAVASPDQPFTTVRPS